MWMLTHPLPRWFCLCKQTSSCALHQRATAGQTYAMSSRWWTRSTNKRWRRSWWSSPRWQSVSTLLLTDWTTSNPAPRSAGAADLITSTRRPSLGGEYRSMERPQRCACCLCCWVALSAGQLASLQGYKGRSYLRRVHISRLLLPRCAWARGWQAKYIHCSTGATLTKTPTMDCVHLCTMHCTAQHSTAQHCTAQHCTALREHCPAVLRRCRSCSPAGWRASSNFRC